MDNNILNFNSSIGGEYLIEIIKSDGSIMRPFGDIKRKNLILDTFFNTVLRDAYRFNVQGFIQACRVGGGLGSDIPAERTQTGLQGTQVLETYIGDAFTAIVATGTASTVSLSRDFKFDVNNTANPIVCREAVIGLFNSNVAGSNITVSRFVFPADIIINNGEQLRISYTLNIKVGYLTANTPVTLFGNNFNLSGNVRLAGQYIAVIGQDPSLNDGFHGISTYLTTDNSTYYKRLWKTVNSGTFTLTTTNGTSYGIFSTLFGISDYYDNIGFFDTAHASALTTYPNTRPSFTASGPLGYFSRSNYQINESGASIDCNYYFPPHTADRTVAGLYLWYRSSSGVGSSAIYIRFTENDFTTARSLLIPATVPVGFKVRWFFSR
jgi:hypothetical protein